MLRLRRCEASSQDFQPEQPATGRDTESTSPPPIATPVHVSGVPRFELISIQELLVAPVRPALRVLTPAVALVLMIACVNVANLLLARTTARRRKLAIRRAIGAGPGRLLRQALTESIALALAGGALGIAVTVGAIELLQTIGVSLPRWDLTTGVSVPRLQEVAIDARVLFFAGSAVDSHRPGVRTGSSDTRGVGESDEHPSWGLGPWAPGFNLFRRHRLHGILIVGEVTAAMMLLAGGGLLAVSFAKLLTVNRGYGACGRRDVSGRFAEAHGPARGVRRAVRRPYPGFARRASGRVHGAPCR